MRASSVLLDSQMSRRHGVRSSVEVGDDGSGNPGNTVMPGPGLCRRYSFLCCLVPVPLSFCLLLAQSVMFDQPANKVHAMFFFHDFTVFSLFTYMISHIDQTTHLCFGETQ